MSKIWTIARREYFAMVATKAFVLSVMLMPVLMFGGIFVARAMKDVRDTREQIMVIADGTGGVLFADLQKAAAARNASLARADGKQPDVPELALRRHGSDSFSESDQLELSDQVRSEQIAAFVEIPPDVLSTSPATSASSRALFYAQNPMLSPERGWIGQALNTAIQDRRLQELELDADAVRRATARVDVAALGLFKKTSAGEVRGADERQNMMRLLLPFGYMMLMFMVIMLSAQPMLETVLEEKAQRIAEVLLGSASPFQLMLGKLLGNVAGSLTVIGVYATGGVVAAMANDWGEFIPLDVLPWFLVYQLLAVFLFSSIFMAVGAAANQLKEAQSMLLPVWLLLASPMFVWLQIVREPNGPIATAMTFFPPATPMVMVLRLASETTVPAWQILVSLILLIAATLVCVLLAGRVFRIGLLWQGNTPRLKELLRWAIRG